MNIYFDETSTRTLQRLWGFIDADGGDDGKDWELDYMYPKKIDAINKVVYNIHMSLEHRDSPETPPIYKIDISAGWDTESQVKIFRSALKKLPFYRKGLLYSGFNGDQIGKSFSCTEAEGVVFCALEEAFGSWDNDPFEFALEHRRSAMSVYDPSMLEYVVPELEGSEGYKIRDPSALLAIIAF